MLRFDFVNQANAAINQHTLFDIFNLNEGGPRSPQKRNRSHADFNRVCPSSSVCELATIVHCTGTRLPERLLESSIPLKQIGGRPPNQGTPRPPEHHFCRRIRLCDFAILVQ
jgi:hypothetical protein